MTAYAKNSISSWSAQAAAVPALNKLARLLSDFNTNLDAILNRGIRFEDNVDCRLISYTSNATPDTADTVAHALGKTPMGFIVYDIDKGGVVYRGGAFSSTNVTLKCSAASAAVKVILF